MTDVIEAVYRYRYLDGSPAYEVVRYRPKRFSQRHLVNGKYVYNLHGVETVLYRLPEIAKAIEQGQWIILCAGEKDAERAVSLGFEATTCPAGEGNWRPQYSLSLAHAKVAIVPDNDAAGIRAAYKVANELWDYCDIVKIARLNFPGKDLTDFFDAGGTVEQFIEWIDQADIHLPLKYAIYYRNKFRRCKTDELYDYLDMIKQLDQPRFTGVLTILEEEFKRRVKIIEHKKEINKYIM